MKWFDKFKSQKKKDTIKLRALPEVLGELLTTLYDNKILTEQQINKILFKED